MRMLPKVREQPDRWETSGVCVCVCVPGEEWRRGGRGRAECHRSRVPWMYEQRQWRGDRSNAHSPFPLFKKRKMRTQRRRKLPRDGGGVDTSLPPVSPKLGWGWEGRAVHTRSRLWGNSHTPNEVDFRHLFLLLLCFSSLLFCRCTLLYRLTGLWPRPLLPSPL